MNELVGLVLGERISSKLCSVCLWSVCCFVLLLYPLSACSPLSISSHTSAYNHICLGSYCTYTKCRCSDCTES